VLARLADIRRPTTPKPWCVTTSSARHVDSLATARAAAPDKDVDDCSLTAGGGAWGEGGGSGARIGALAVDLLELTSSASVCTIPRRATSWSGKRPRRVRACAPAGWTWSNAPTAAADAPHSDATWRGRWPSSVRAAK
jgi:hypothetical protein